MLNINKFVSFMSLNFISGNRVFLMITLYLVVIIFGLKNAALDHGDYVGVMAELIENGAGAELDYSFFLAYNFFSSFVNLGVDPEMLATFLGFFILYYSFYYKLTFADFVVLFLLFLPAFFMNLGKPSKEFFVTLFFLLTLHFCARGRYLWGAIFVLLYALLFRIYYVPLGLLILYFSITDGRIKILASLSAIFATTIVALLYFDEVVDFLGSVQARRDVGYFSSADMRRTGFYNLYSISDIYGITLNYFYAFLKINFPIFFSFQLKDIFLQMYVFIILVVNFKARKVYFLALPLFVNFLVYPLFEPDLGSYLRHLASIYPLYFSLYLLWRDNVVSRSGDGIHVWRF